LAGPADLPFHDVFTYDAEIATSMKKPTTHARRRITRKILQIGPHPVLLGRYSIHHVLAHRRQGRLRRHYNQLVVSRPGRLALRIPPLELSPFNELPQALIAAAERIREEADHVIAHRIDLLGSGLVQLGNEIDWHLDFKSGYRWPSDFYQDVQPTRLDDSSDAKVPWELSRGHHLLTLARAARIFEDERFADELEGQLRSWLDANPPGYGINWTNPMEVGLRAVNWVWALRTIETFRPLHPGLRAKLASALLVHAQHIDANLEETPQLRSNHYLSDILGLLVVGATLPDDPIARRHFQKASRAFEREILRQVHEDGIGFEASLPYHCLALEIFLLATTIANWRGAAFSSTYMDRLEQMLVATRSLRHPDGRLPQIGDGDSGRVLPAGSRRQPQADHLLWLGAAIVGSERPDGDPPHEEVAWTLGMDAWRRASKLPEATKPDSRAFPDGGLFVMRSKQVQAVVRCGDVGQNGNGGHAHNDLLSFELSYGVTLVVDSGTYIYTSDPAARNSFRSTAAHNTVVVRKQEINPIVEHELFKLRQFAHPHVELWEELPDQIRLVARHDGYRRLEPSVMHRRTFSLERASSHLEVKDELLGHGTQEAESFVHLAPGTHVTRNGERRFELACEGKVIALTWWGASQVDLSEGWVSDRFGVRERGPVLIARAAGDLPLNFGYRFTPCTENWSRTTRQ
jgi:hypothetical protein